MNIGKKKLWCQGKTFQERHMASEVLPQTDPPSVAGYCGGRASGEKSYSTIPIILCVLMVLRKPWPRPLAQTWHCKFGV